MSLCFGAGHLSFPSGTSLSIKWEQYQPERRATLTLEENVRKCTVDLDVWACVPRPPRGLPLTHADGLSDLPAPGSPGSSQGRLCAGGGSLAPSRDERPLKRGGGRKCTSKWTRIIFRNLCCTVHCPSFKVTHRVKAISFQDESRHFSEKGGHRLSPSVVSRDATWVCMVITIIL